MRTLRYDRRLRYGVYYFEKQDAAVASDVNRLDSDNKPQTTAVLQLVFKTIVAELK